MSRRKRITLTTLAVVVAMLAAVSAWQWNNLMAVLTYLRYSKEDLKAQASAESSSLSEALGKLPGDVYDLSDGEKQALINGDITEQEAVALILEKSAESSASVSKSPDTTATPEPGLPKTSPSKPDPSTRAEAKSTPALPAASPSPPPNDDDEKIQELIAKLYVLRTTFVSSLDRLMESARQEYSALPAEGQTDSARNSLAVKYMGLALSMENDCDTQVNSILSQLRALLEKAGGDLTMIDDIQDEYKQEKIAKKAYYISLLQSS